jgi:hypothetical protein
VSQGEPPSRGCPDRVRLLNIQGRKDRQAVFLGTLGRGKSCPLWWRQYFWARGALGKGRDKASFRSLESGQSVLRYDSKFRTLRVCIRNTDLLLGLARVVSIVSGESSRPFLGAFGRTTCY